MLSLTLIAVGCLAALVIYLPISCFLNYRKCPGIKGPFLASISGLWLFRATCRSSIYLDLPAAFEQYGTNIIRIAPKKVATNDPEIWRYLNSPKCRFTRGSWYDGMKPDPYHDNVFSCRDDKAHNALRAMLIRGYSGKELPNLESNIDNRIVDLMTLIRSKIAQGEPVEFARIIQYFTLDVLTEIAFEEPLGFLTKNEDIFEYIKTIEGFMVILETGLNFPFVQRILHSRLMAGLSPKPTDKTGLGALVGVAHKVVNRRYEPDAKHRDDMLGSFIKGGLTKEQAMNESSLQILAGSDVMASAIRMMFLYIITNPTVYMKLRAEIDENAGRITKPVITSAEGRSLPYLQACIKESLRVFPPLAGLLTKRPPPGGETIGGVYIPEDVEVCWSSFSMQHREDIYGADAKIFRPERWLEAATLKDDGATLNKMERTMELVFGSGKYGCLGKTIAWIELDKIFVPLLQNFDWGIVNPVTPIHTKCPGGHMQHDFWLRVTERTK